MKLGVAQGGLSPLHRGLARMQGGCRAENIVKRFLAQKVRSGCSAQDHGSSSCELKAVAKERRKDRIGRQGTGGMKRVLEIQKAMKTVKGEVQEDGSQRGPRPPFHTACFEPRTIGLRAAGCGLRAAGSGGRGAKSDSQLSIATNDTPENP